MEENQESTATSSSNAKSTSPMKYAMIGLVLLLVIGGGLYLGKKAMKHVAPTTDKQVQGAMTEKSMKADTTVTPAASTTAAMTANELDVTVTGSNFKFEPATISAKKGQTVKLTFSNADGFHDLNIDELNVHTKKIQANAQDTVTFTADKTGTFEYYCSVGKHRAMGMVGKITVE